MFTQKKKVSIIIPCFNEQDALPVLLEKFSHDAIFHALWEMDVLVVDNNSTDQTSKVAKDYGVRVEFEQKKGKGYALQRGLQHLPHDVEFVVMMDGDNTYHPQDLHRMIEPLASGFCEAVLGSRMQGKVHEGAMSFESRLGNWLFSFLVRSFYKQNVTDVLTGYFAWKKTAIDKLLPHLESTGFELEMELITKMAKLGIDAYSVPISYHGRIGHSKLHHLQDGVAILNTFIRNLRWTPGLDY